MKSLKFIAALAVLSLSFSTPAARADSISGGFASVLADPGAALQAVQAAEQVVAQAREAAPVIADVGDAVASGFKRLLGAVFSTGAESTVTPATDAVAFSFERLLQDDGKDLQVLQDAARARQLAQPAITVPAIAVSDGVGESFARMLEDDGDAFRALLDAERARQIAQWVGATSVQ